MPKLFKKPLFLLSIFYFLIRLPHLVKLPISNDEAIYIDWGYRATHVPGHLYYSLYDAKQPLMIWLFGIFNNFFTDPLFAARLVSLLLGLLTMLGIYKIAITYFSKRIAVSSSLLYTVIPIFTLFDRQALLESGVATSGVWSCYFLLRLIYEKRNKYAYLLGLVLGLGFFTKSTAALFLLTALVVMSIYYLKNKQSNLLKQGGIVIGIFFTTILLLLINQQFWHALPTTSRYVYTLGEIVRFPIMAWMQNIVSTFEISFFFLTPLVLALTIGGMYFAVNKKGHFVLVLWLIIPLLLHTLTVKVPSQRYLVSLLPISVLFVFYFIEKIASKKLFAILTLFVISMPLAFTLILIYSPYTYFTLSKKISRYPESGYIDGHLSGYGIEEALEFIKTKGKSEKLVVAYAENTGNPENALIVYLQNNKEIPHAYLERRYFDDTLTDKDCIVLQSGHEVYFVSRNEQQAGLEQYLEKVKTIKKPNSNDTIGIYHLKNNCNNPLIVQLTFIN